MTAFATYKEGEKAKLNPGLLWEYRLEGFDWQKYRKTVVERVIAMGRLSDCYSGATRPTTPSWPTRPSSTLATLTSC